MALLAFQIVRASQINRIQPVEYPAVQSGNAGSVQTVTTTETDSLGCSVTFTTTTAANCTVIFFCDVEVQVTGVTTFQGRIRVDGSTITLREAHITGASLIRVTCGQAVDFTVSGAGSHTVNLRVLKTAAAATVVIYDSHTLFTVQVREIV